MKLKDLRKKIRRLEKRLQESPKKLARLKEKLKAAEAAKALKAARKSAARTTAKRLGNKPSPSAEAKKSRPVKKAKRKLNLSPERRAQLAAAMKARWAAKRAAEAITTTVSSDAQHSVPELPPQPTENRQGGA